MFLIDWSITVYILYKFENSIFHGYTNNILENNSKWNIGKFHVQSRWNNCHKTNTSARNN